jgi:hypothetical protein
MSTKEPIDTTVLLNVQNTLKAIEMSNDILYRVYTEVQRYGYTPTLESVLLELQEDMNNAVLRVVKSYASIAVDSILVRPVQESADDLS